MIIGKRHRYVFVSCTRCCTHSMYRFLIERYEGRHLTLIREGRTSGGADPFHIPGREIPEEYRGFFSFCVVRDPYARAVSLWRYLWATRARPAFFPCMGDGSFLAFVRALEGRAFDALEAKWRDHVLNQVEWHAGFAPSMVMRAEAMKRGVAALPFTREYDIPDVLNTGDSVGGRPVPEWTDECLDAIRPWAMPDCLRFNYPVR